MSLRRFSINDARIDHTLLLWWGAGLGLMAVVADLTSEGSAPLALYLILAGLAGTLVFIEPAYGVLALTSTFFLSYPAALQGSGRFTINNALGLVLAGALLIMVAVDRRAEFLRLRSVQLFLLVGFALVVNQLLAEQSPAFAHLVVQDLTQRRWNELTAKLAFFIFLVAFIRTPRHLTLLVASVVLFVLITAPNAISNAMMRQGADIEDLRASSNFGIVVGGNANRLAFVSAIAIVLIGHAIQEIRSRVTTLAGGAAITLLMITIFLSASRSGFINLVALLGIFLIRTVRRRGRWVRLVVWFVLALAITVAVVPHAYLDRITNLFGVEEHTAGARTSMERLGLLKTGLRMFVDQPIVGVGLGNHRWLSVVDYQASHFSALHNSYVLTLVEGGILLLIPYLLLLWQTWRDLKTAGRLAAQHPTLRMRWLVDATQTIFVMFLIFSLFADLWHEVFLFLIVGLSAVLLRIYRQEAGSPVAA